MREETFKNFWIDCWKNSNNLKRLLLIVLAPYLWVCYGLANSGYED